VITPPLQDGQSMFGAVWWGVHFERVITPHALTPHARTPHTRSERPTTQHRTYTARLVQDRTPAKETCLAQTLADRELGCSARIRQLLLQEIVQ
jgi:hypothetical protein